jgi:AraC-like DNA-binding protein
MHMFFVAGIGLAVFIEFLLLTKRDKTGPDWILTGWMFLVLTHLSLMYAFFTDALYRFPFLLGLEHPLPLLHGVFLFFYVSALTDQLPENRRLLILHVVPAVVMYLYLTSFFVLPAEQKIQVYQHQGAGYELFTSIKRYAIAISGIAYVAWSAILLRRHRQTIREQFSDLDKINLRWLHLLTIGLGCIWTLVILFHNDMLVFAGAVVFVFLIGFFGVRQAHIFTSHRRPAESEGQKKKYPKSGLTDDAAGALHLELKGLMSGESLYKKSDLSINDLSTRLGVHPNYLSQVINQKEQKNFYDFVNTYRLEEFKRLAAMPGNRRLTLLSLAYDCGFSSKSSFNRYFKKATGQTPSEYFAALVGDPGHTS